MVATADRRPSRRLGKILLWRVLLTGLALTAVLSLLQAGLDYRGRIVDLQGKLSRLEVTHGRALTESLWKMDRQLVDAELEGILNIPYVVHVAIVEKGVTTHEVGRSPAGRAIRREFPLFWEHRGRPVPLGTLQVEAGPGLVLSATTGRIALILLFQLATVGVTAAIMLLVFNRLVTWPVNAMSRYFAAVASESTPPPLRLEKTIRNDEIDLLAGAFNDLLERLNASQRRLRESEEKLQALYREAALGIFHSTLDGRFIDVNPALARLLGYDAPEEVLVSITSIAGQVYAEPPVYDEVARQVLESGGTLTRENHYRRRDGTLWWGLLSLRVIRDAQGRPSHYEGFVEDITERKRAEEALRGSEKKYRGLVDLTHDLVWEVDTEGRITFMSPASRRIYGREPEEMIGRLYDEFVAPEEIARDRAELKRALATGGATLSFENRVVHRDGHEVVLLANAVVRRDEAGKIVGTVGTSQDITERKRAEEALRGSQQILENIINAIPVRVFWKDRNLVYLGCNAAFARDAGFADPKDIVGKDDHQMGWRAQADRYRRDDREVIESGRPKLLVEEPQTTPDGNTITLLTSKIPLRNPQGEISGVLGTYLDITEQVRARAEKAGLEAQLLQAQKLEAIGRLAGGVAHDFNNMTAIIIGYGEMLLGRLGADDPGRKWAEQIVEAGKRSADLTRQLLAFSRRQVLLPVVLDLNDLLRNLEKMLGRLIGENIVLAFDLAADLGRITADPGQVEQVVTNLVINARDAMPRGGRIAVETANVDLDETFARDHQGVVPGEYVMLALTDTGSGMDKATLARIFEPFFTTKERGKGTGLGLATAFGIVKQSGGYLYVSSEPGEGTTFTIYLPRTHAEVRAAAIEPSGEALRGGGELVLLVEDEASLRELCASMLRRLGYRVIVAGTGQEALALVAEQGLEPDLVVTDVIMPGISGAEMMEQFHRDRPGLKMLYMSGHPDEAIAHHGVLDPGTSFLQKPFSERDLAAKVRDALRREEGGARVGKSVLMIDDDVQYRDLVRHFCAKWGYVFAGVASPAAALTALAGQSYDVLLIDMNLSGTDGGRVLREIRAAGHAAPAIVLTGDVASADMAALEPLGVVSIVEKSGRSEQLQQAIDAVSAPKARPEQTGTG